MGWAINNKRVPNPSAFRESCYEVLYILVWHPVILRNSWTHLMISKGIHSIASAGRILLLAPRMTPGLGDDKYYQIWEKERT
jgi:hypothetical protein